MSEVGGEGQEQRWGAFAAIVAALFILNRLRKRRKMKKLLKMRARARARADKTRRKAADAKAKAVAKKLPGKKEKKKKSQLQKLISFAAFQILKKIISEQIKQMEIDLSQNKLGKKITEAVGS
jgi:ABC-type protease/lipase transport system fused ATPase/permease subunit